MHTNTIAVSAAVLAGAASAASPSALITIETSHGGAGSDLTNTTITVPIGSQPYTDSSALSAVSTLYLTSVDGVSLDSVTCTPYISTNGTGPGGLPFTSTTPSYLSTNTVQVGSIVCLSSDSSSSSSSSSASSVSTITPPFPTATGSTGAGNGTSSGNGTITLSTKPTPSPTTIVTATSITTEGGSGTTGSAGATQTTHTAGATAFLPKMPYVVSGMLAGVFGIMFTL